MQPLDRRPHHTRTKKLGPEGAFWFHWSAKMARSYAHGSEERFWYAFKNWLNGTNGWLTTDWMRNV